MKRWRAMSTAREVRIKILKAEKRERLRKEAEWRQRERDLEDEVAMWRERLFSLSDDVIGLAARRYE